jgi:hypothetical protein
VDVDRLAGTERSQEELFHLFDELNRAGVQLVFTAAVPPQSLELHARLRSRLESGLVVEAEQQGADLVEAETEPADAGAEPADAETQPVEAEAVVPVPDVVDVEADAVAAEAEAAPVDSGLGANGQRGPTGDWYLSGEKIVKIWPYTENWLMEGLD